MIGFHLFLVSVEIDSLFESIKQVHYILGSFLRQKRSDTLEFGSIIDEILFEEDLEVLKRPTFHF